MADKILEFLFTALAYFVLLSGAECINSTSVLYDKELDLHLLPLFANLTLFIFMLSPIQLLIKFSDLYRIHADPHAIIYIDNQKTQPGATIFLSAGMHVNESSTAYRLRLDIPILFNFLLDDQAPKLSYQLFKPIVI